MRLNPEVGRFIGRAALAGTILFGTPIIASRDTYRVEQQVQAPNLGLKIDKRGWEEIIRGGFRWGSVPEVIQKDQMACPTWSTGICMGKYSPTFNVGVNGPMAKFMFRQTGSINPVKSIQLIFSEEWITGDDSEHLLGQAKYYDNETLVIISLKSTALLAFKVMEHEGTLNVVNASEHFEGTMSLLVSTDVAHELAHAGAQYKILGDKILDKRIRELTHPQVYKFESDYDRLIRQAASRGRTVEGLMFGVQPKEGVSLPRLREQLQREAIQLGLDIHN